MAEERIEQLVVEMRADIRRYEAAMRRAHNETKKETDKMRKQFERMHKDVSSASAQMSRDVRRAIAGIALAAAGKEVLDYEATWRNATNTMRQYTDVMGDADTSTSALSATATEAGVKMGSLSNLVGAGARAARDLGKSGDDVLQFAATVSKSTAIANNGASAVDGAMLQLSQAISSPRVQLQEFNSVIEGTPRLAQAFADGVDGAGGSIAKLRAMIANGDVSGGQLFDAILSQTDKIRSEFGKVVQGYDEALNRFNNKMAEFIGTNKTATGAAMATADAINWVADNLDTLTDAVLIGGAALAGAYGASVLTGIASGMQKVAVGATASAKALSLMRAASAFMFGPAGLVIGAGALAAAFAAMAIEGGRAESVLDQIAASGGDLGEALQIAQRYADLSDIGDTAEESTPKVSALAGALGEVVAAMQDRALLTFLEDVQKINTAIAEAEATIEAAERKRRNMKRAPGLEMMRAGGSEEQIEGAIERADVDTSELDREIGVLGAKLSGLKKYRDQIGANILGEGGNAEIMGMITAGDPAGAIEALRDRVVAAREEIAGDGGGVTSPVADADQVKAAEDAVAELERAYLATFESEREGIARNLRERLAAIEIAQKSEAEKARLREQAEALARSQMADVRAEGQAAFDDWVAKELEKDKLREEQTASEIEALQRVMDARDRMSGRVFSIIDREYEARRAAIEAEIEDVARRNEALLALEEEHALAKEQLRQEVFGEGEFSDDRADQIEAQRDEELARLEDWYEQNLEREAEYQARRNEIIAEAAEEVKAIEKDRVATQLENTANGFGQMAQLAKVFVGEQSGIYKTLFGIQKAFALASAMVTAPDVIMKAWNSAPFPANMPAVTLATVETAGLIAKIAGQGPGFKRGGYTGDGPADEEAGPAHRGEYYFTKAETAMIGRANLAALARRARSGGGSAAREVAAAPTLPGERRSPASNSPAAMRPMREIGSSGERLPIPSAIRLEGLSALASSMRNDGLRAPAGIDALAPVPDVGAMPSIALPAMPNAGSQATSISMGKTELHVSGGVDADVMPRLMAEIKRRDDGFVERVQAVIARERVRTTPRHERGGLK